VQPAAHQRVEPTLELPPAEAAGRFASDPLAQALAWLTRHHGRDRSAESLLSGQPVTGPLGPDQAVRAMREAGYNAGLVQRRVGDINALLLPAVLLLKNADACILVRRDGERFEVVMPGGDSHAITATEADLASEYTGVALVATPQAQPTTGPSVDPQLIDPARHWFWGTMRRFMPYYRSAMLAALLSNVLMLVTGVVTAVVYDKVIPNQAYVTLWALASAAGISIVFDLCARQLRAHLIDLAGRKADLMVGAALFRQSLAVRLEYRPDSAGAYAHVLGQIETVREFFSSATLSAVSDLPFIVIFAGMVFVIGGPLGWVPLLAIPAILTLSVLIQGSLQRAMSANMQQHADLHGLLVESVDGLEDIKAAGAQGRFVRHYEEATAAVAESAMRSRRISSAASNLAAVTQPLVTLALLVWGVYLIDDKVISSGALIGAVMFATRSVAPLNAVVGLAMRYQGARAAMRALNKVMSHPVERELGRAYVSQRNLSGRIALREVGFAYPSADPKAVAKVLKGVSLQFAPGERVAILGRIGSGKSTVLRLLAGLYQPTEGQVEADGIDLRQIDPADFRVRVGFVAQDPRLFNGTLRDNVLLDRPGADAERLSEVAQLTGLSRLAAAHPMGWDLPVGEAGSLLSGGQRQLVALARCLITRPQIILMDEPTSSMDAQSEVAFLRHLQQACGHCTLIVVTHRPAVLDLVQRIVVIDGGRVVADGPKAQVLAALSAPPAPSPAAATAPGAPVPLRPASAPQVVPLVKSA
jgi:ATP-binding cassette subfamily C protein LapB